MISRRPTSSGLDGQQQPPTVSGRASDRTLNLQVTLDNEGPRNTDTDGKPQSVSAAYHFVRSQAVNMPPQQSLLEPPRGLSSTVGLTPSPAPSRVDTHVQRISTRRRYMCEICNKTFSRPSTVRIHGRSHSGEQPFHCQQPKCDRAFSVRSNMRHHERACTGQRPARQKV